MTNFKNGQTVYSITGEEMEFAGKIENVTFVRRVIDRGDDEPYVSDMHKYSGELFAEPPVFKIEEKCAKRLAHLDDLNRQIAEQDERLSEAKSQTLDLVKLSKKHDEFRILVDYLEGRITHVVNSGEAEIAPLDSVLTGKYDRDSWQRPIGLFAVPNPPKGNVSYHHQRVSWKIGSYASGSGGWEDLSVFPSEDAAREYVKKLVEEKLRAWRVLNTQYVWWLQNAQDKNPWLEFPEDWVSARRERKLSAIKDRIKRAQDDLRLARDDLSKAEAGS
jgi:hypothetical protein